MNHSTRIRLGRTRGVLVLLAVSAAGVLIGTTTASAATYSLTDSVKMRDQPTAGSSYSAIAPSGSSIAVNCQQWGEAQGPNGNTLWLNVNGSGRNSWWVNDAWTSSPHLAADKTNGIAGVAWCSPNPTTPTLPAPSRDTKVWVGAPFAGAWPGSARSTSSLPANHKPVYKVPGHSWLSDWALDYYAVAGTSVKVYVAPKDSRLASRITTQVLDVQPTCAAVAGETASQRIARGGYVVFVGVFDSGLRVGTVAYAHVNPAFATSYRGTLNRWGGVVGTVGQYTYNKCWQVSVSTGHHVHMEFSNENPTYMACYRPNVPQNATLAVSEYMGYLGGAFATTRQQACPVGA